VRVSVGEREENDIDSETYFVTSASRSFSLKRFDARRKPDLNAHEISGRSDRKRQKEEE
jgi:hypothetical protein